MATWLESSSRRPGQEPEIEEEDAFKSLFVLAVGVVPELVPELCYQFRRAALSTPDHGAVYNLAFSRVLESLKVNDDPKMIAFVRGLRKSQPLRRAVYATLLRRRSRLSVAK